MDAELAGTLVALREGYAHIALDSQGAIQRMGQLYTEPPRSWIEFQLQKENKMGCNVGDRDPAHYRDAAHRAQPAQN